LHQSFSASVHSRARRMSSISKQAESTLQYDLGFDRIGSLEFA
jgi:hypothetical protein